MLPTRIRVLAWPAYQSKKSNLNTLTMTKKENSLMAGQPMSARLSYAEEALRTMSLPEGLILSQKNCGFS